MIIAIYLVCMAVIVFSLFMASVRNDVVYKARIKAINIVYSGEDWVARRKLFSKAGTYDQMMWQFTKWRMKDFFPELAKLDEPPEDYGHFLGV